jgi:misacylated tRNA(Ala) deacylase
MKDMYLEDGYLWAFDATVVDVSADRAILDKTAFYPQSGGQPADAGFLIDRRYRFMRSHTACHILSAVIFQETGARITGNQIEQSRSRVDFSPENKGKANRRVYFSLED